ncbi:hypothetical protein IG193_00490 [Infirmifilum lucidum]|uniref:HD-CE domain-containing protein n=1 Tax=Infirmifilum lucidum TaxID=2776706 RepID=A0A7L9FGU5_9CREN|nr:hypothetical protein [Infirmifilum lucidum]QOJ78979.1 hypothetical protein IG193_00490 [Infirmifilum lucidum]
MPGTFKLRRVADYVVETASSILPYANLFFFHYTYHDHRHSKNLEMYFKSLYNETWYGNINGAEHEVIRMAVYLHDIGMAYNPRNWADLQLSKEEVETWAGKWCAEDPLRKIEDYFVSSICRGDAERKLLDGLREGSRSITDVFFPRGVLEFPHNLKDKAWDDIPSYAKETLRAVMRKLHPYVSAAYSRDFILKEWPELGRVLALVVESHDLENPKCYPQELEGGVRIEAVDFPDEVDVLKVVGVLNLLDSIDCAGRSRGDEKTLKNIVEDIALLGAGYLTHWVFKMPIESVDPKRDGIKIRLTRNLYTDKLRLADLVGALLFEVAQNVYPKYRFARKILERRGVGVPDLYVALPGGEEVLFDDRLFSTAKIYQDEKVQVDGGTFSLFDGLALLVARGRYAEADSIARKIACSDDVLRRIKMVKENCP